MADPQFVEILQKTISPAAADQKQAYEFLEQAVQTNFPSYVQQLSIVLRDVNCPGVARQVAGLQLKNALYTQDNNKSEKAHRWLALGAELRADVKRNALETLGSETQKSTAAQVIANIASIEIPEGQWLEVIPCLTNRIKPENLVGVAPAAESALKISCIEAIGYLCESMETLNIPYLATQSDNILTAIVSNMNKDEPNLNLILAASTALHNSLTFCKANFNKEVERNYLMQCVCYATQYPDDQVKVMALQCFVKIASLYYDHLEIYMAVALFPITKAAISSENSSISMQGIEFWSTICEEERDIMEEIYDAENEGETPSRHCMHYAKGALPFMAPLLLQKLTEQNEDDDEDEWTVSKAAGVSLMLFASILGEDVIPHIIPFVMTNVNDDSWRKREAALMALGCVFDEAIEIEKIRDLSLQALPMLASRLGDTSVQVRDTAAWCISRSVANNGDVVVQVGVENLITPLLRALGQEARVSENACWAFNALTESLFDKAVCDENANEPSTYGMSQHFAYVTEELFKVTEREVSLAKPDLRTAAYQAIMGMMKYSPRDCTDTVLKCLNAILTRLNYLMEQSNALGTDATTTGQPVARDRAGMGRSDAAQQLEDIQSHLCATLDIVIRKIPEKELFGEHAYADHIMSAMLTLLECQAKKKTPGGSDANGVRHDALSAISGLVDVAKTTFIKYMPTLQPYLRSALLDKDDTQVVIVAIGLVGDLSRALGTEFEPFAHDLMASMYEILTDDKVDKTVKPHVLTTFGDAAFALGGQKFQLYFNETMSALKHAGLITISDPEDPNEVDFLNELQENCLQAYTSIVQGFRSGGSGSGDATPVAAEVSLITQFLPDMFNLMVKVQENPARTDGSLRNAVGLIGDLAQSFGGHVLQFAMEPRIQKLLTDGKKSRTAKTKTTANWASREIKKLEKNASLATAGANGSVPQIIA